MSILSKIIKQPISILSKVKSSVIWLKIKLNKTGWKTVTKPEPGKLYLAIYDAKYRDTLPIWDAAPLSMFWKADARHIYGLNFHFLSIPAKKKLLGALKKAAGKRKYPQISSALVSQLAKHPAYKPAVKMYLYDHFKSNLLLIPVEEWEKVIYLPLAKMHKN